MKGIVSNSVILKEQFKEDVLSKKIESDKEIRDQKKRLESKLKRLQRDLEHTIENISLTEVNRIQGRKDKRVVEKVLSLLDDEKNTLEREYQKTFQDIEDLDSRKEWLDWLGRFGKSLEVKTSNEKNTRDFLNGLVKQIVVHPEYRKDRDGEEVQVGQTFDIHFKMKIVSDKLRYKDINEKSLGYDLIEGGYRKKSPVLNLTKGRGQPKKKTNTA